MGGCAVDQGNEWRGEKQGIHDADRHVGLIVKRERDGGDGGGIADTGEPVIGRGLGIGDHEEGEQHERAGLELLDGDGERIAEICRARQQKARVGGQERQRDVEALGPGQDEHAEAREREHQQRFAAPLAGRDPGVAGCHDEGDDGEVGRVEDMLSVDAD
jgi:hypothetical protein